MLSKKALFLVTEENEIEPLIAFAKKFKEKYKVEIDTLYVKDILKYELFPITIEGFGVNLSTTYVFNEYKELEKKTFKKIEETANGEFSKIYSKEGETVEIALEELKKYDFLVVVKNEKVTQNLKDLLRSNFKPIIILPNKTDFEIENLLLLDDGAYNANKTLFTFFHIFEEQKIDVLRVNVENEDNLKERFLENYNLINRTGDPFKTIIEVSENYDFILMGDLRYTVMVERITGKLGIKLLEKLDKPIFIV